MNFKMLFPTYRARFLYARRTLGDRLQGTLAGRGLSLGCGEGDYDAAIAGFTHHLDACDINPGDLAFAAALNRAEPRIHYSVQDGTRLSFEAESYDFVTCIDVIEHVGDRPALLREIHRVLRPGGFAVLTCPNHDFPVTYDPVNLLLRPFGGRIPCGAYGYGHTRLMQDAELREWFAAAGLRVESDVRLTRALAAVTELYWVSLAQKLFKANSTNQISQERRALALKPGAEEPALVSLVDRLVRLDERLLRRCRRSVGLGYVLRRA